MRETLYLNFKTYKEATGENALRLARAAESVAKKSGKNIALCVQAIDLRQIAENTKLEVFAQHLDPAGFGSFTGKINPLAIKEAGAAGSLLNHAENKQSNEFLEKTIGKAREAGLKIMVCAESTERLRQICEFKEKPDWIAIEPPELIGGDISVSTAQPELITESVEIGREYNVQIVTGAGIKTAEDVRIAIKLGTVGVLVASGVIKAENQEKALEELIKGFK